MLAFVHARRGGRHGAADGTSGRVARGAGLGERRRRRGARPVGRHRLGGRRGPVRARLPDHTLG